MNKLILSRCFRFCTYSCASTKAVSNRKGSHCTGRNNTAQIFQNKFKPNLPKSRIGSSLFKPNEFKAFKAAWILAEFIFPWRPFDLNTLIPSQSWIITSLLNSELSNFADINSGFLYPLVIKKSVKKQIGSCFEGSW